MTTMKEKAEIHFAQAEHFLNKFKEERAAYENRTVPTITHPHLTIAGVHAQLALAAVALGEMRG